VVVVTVVLALLLALVVIVVGMAQLQQLPASLEVRDRLRLSPALWRVAGVVQLVAAAGLILGVSAPLLGMAAVALGLLVVVFVAALALHARVHDWTGLVPAAVMLVWTLVLVALVPTYRQ